MTVIDFNAGCGDYHPPGWVNADVSDACRPDFISDLTDLPFGDGTVGRIFAAHVLEHIEYHHRLPVVLAEFRRVLADDGKFCVVGPDIERAVLLDEPRWKLRAVVAWPKEFQVNGTEEPPRGHAWTSTALFTERALEAAGFSCVSYTRRLKAIADEGWPLLNLDFYQLAYVCHKETYAPDLA